MCMRVLLGNMYMHHMHAMPAYEGQKRELDSVELEVEMVARHHVGTGNQTWAVYKSNICT